MWITRTFWQMLGLLENGSWLGCHLTSTALRKWALSACFAYIWEDWWWIQADNGQNSTPMVDKLNYLWFCRGGGRLWMWQHQLSVAEYFIMKIGLSALLDFWCSVKEICFWWPVSSRHKHLVGLLNAAHRGWSQVLHALVHRLWNSRYCKLRRSEAALYPRWKIWSKMDTAGWLFPIIGRTVIVWTR